MQPYRLEMGAKLAVGDAKNLYVFWGDALACAVCGYPCAVRPSAHREAGDAARPEVPPAGDPDRGSACIVNLASVEYAKAVLPHLANHIPIVTCVFSSSLRNGKPVQKSTESKAARGTMVRWMAEMGAEGPRRPQTLRYGVPLRARAFERERTASDLRLHETLGKKREKRRRVRG